MKIDRDRKKFLGKLWAASIFKSADPIWSLSIFNLIDLYEVTKSGKGRVKNMSIWRLGGRGFVSITLAFPLFVTQVINASDTSKFAWNFLCFKLLQNMSYLKNLSTICQLLLWPAPICEYHPSLPPICNTSD